MSEWMFGAEPVLFAGAERAAGYDNAVEMREKIQPNEL